MLIQYQNLNFEHQHRWLNIKLGNWRSKLASLGLNFRPVYFKVIVPQSSIVQYPRIPDSVGTSRLSLCVSKFGWPSLRRLYLSVDIPRSVLAAVNSRNCWHKEGYRVDDWYTKPGAGSSLKKFPHPNLRCCI